MVMNFDDWWTETGRCLDPDTDDVPWFDKRRGLAEYAFDAGLSAARDTTEVSPDVVNALDAYDDQKDLHAGLVGPMPPEVAEVRQQLLAAIRAYGDQRAFDARAQAGDVVVEIDEDGNVHPNVELRRDANGALHLKTGAKEAKDD